MKIVDQLKQIIKKPDTIAVGIFCVLSLVWHIVFLFHLHPMIFPDTIHYMDLASDIRHWVWKDFAYRTPGYPLYIAFVTALMPGDPAFQVAASQVALSATVPLLLYGIFRSLSQSAVIGFLCGMVYFLDLPGQMMSVAVLSETITQFMIVLCVLGTVILAKKPLVSLSVILSLGLFFLAMLRPAMLPFAPAVAILLGGYSIVNRQFDKKARIASGIVLVVPPLLTILWCLEIKRETGKFAISHITGVALVNQVLPQLETGAVPESVKAQPIYKEARNAITESGAENIGWVLVQNTEKDSWEVAEDLKQMSLEIIRSDWKSYFAKVGENCREFWVGDPSYVYRPGVTYNWIKKSPVGIARAIQERILWAHPGRVIKMLWASMALLVLYCVIRRSNRFSILGVLVCAVAICVCMFAHTLFNGVDLARYRMPVQTLLLALFLHVVLDIGRGIKRKNDDAASVKQTVL